MLPILPSPSVPEEPLDAALRDSESMELAFRQLVALRITDVPHAETPAVPEHHSIPGRASSITLQNLD